MNWNSDSRSGVVQAASAKRKSEHPKTKWTKMSAWKKCWPMKKNVMLRGIELIAGVDEVGTWSFGWPCRRSGCDFAGKLVKFQDSTIVKRFQNPNTRKSMKLCSKEAIAIGIGVKDNHVIDQVNIYEATKLAMMEAIGQLRSSTPASFD